MDIPAEFERLLEEMEWGDVVDTFQAVVTDMLDDTPDPLPLLPAPSPSPLPPPAIPSEQGFDTELEEILSGGYGGCIPAAATPRSFEQPLAAPTGLNVRQAAPIIYQQPLYDQNVMPSSQGYSQAGPYSQGQNLPYQWYDGPGPSNVRAPPQQFNNVPVMGIPPDLKDRLVPFRIFKEGILYRLPRAPAPAAPPLNPPVSQKRQREAQQYADRPYIKKPPNAFMLFRKEQRPNVVAELNITESATVNTILGQRWQAMSKEQQAKYFEEADRERQLHEQRYPDWSPKDNYGKKKKRIRTKDSTLAEASASKPDEVTQQAKKQCVTPVQTAAMDPSTSQAAAMEAARTRTGAMQAPAFPTVLVLGAPQTERGGSASSTTTRTVLVKLPDRETPTGENDTFPGQTEPFGAEGLGEKGDQERDGLSGSPSGSFFTEVTSLTEART